MHTRHDDGLVGKMKKVDDDGDDDDVDVDKRDVCVSVCVYKK